MKRVGQWSAFLVLIATSAAAQTNDVVYGSWNWSTSSASPKGLGMGGAQVAAFDDATALGVNPAVLTTLTSTQLFGSAFNMPAATIGRGDENQGRGGVGVTGGGGLVTPKLAIGGFIVQPRSVNTRLSETALVPGLQLSGSLRSVLTDVGVGGALRVGQRLHLGAQVVGTHLELEGVGSRFIDGREVLRMGTSSGSTRFVGAFGLLFEGSRTLTIGASAQSGTTYTADRTAINPSLPLTLDEGSEYDIQRPFRGSVGLNWTATQKLRVVAQLDYVAYGKIAIATTFADGGGPETLDSEDGLEPRGGIEVSLPFRNSGALQLRAGAHYRASGALAYTGADETFAATFPGGERDLEPTVGATLVLPAFAIHAAYTSGNTPLLALGGTLRF